MNKKVFIGICIFLFLLIMSIVTVYCINKNNDRKADIKAEIKYVEAIITNIEDEALEDAKKYGYLFREHKLAGYCFVLNEKGKVYRVRKITSNPMNFKSFNIFDYLSEEDRQKAIEKFQE